MVSLGNSCLPLRGSLGKVGIGKIFGFFSLGSFLEKLGLIPLTGFLLERLGLRKIPFSGFLPRGSVLEKLGLRKIHGFSS